MMDQIIKLKRSRSRVILRPSRGIFLLTALLLCAVTARAEQASLMLKNVGVIPVQWEGSFEKTAGIENARSAIDRYFPQVVRESYRFQVLDDDLVKDLWSEPDGRYDLANQYEMHAFASLSVVSRDDVATFISRLMSPTMKVQMFEQENLPKSWLENASQEQIVEKMRALNFRLYNRLPIDVTVTSVQGKYVTITGGRKQGLSKDDKFPIVRAQVSAVHPADGTWLKFKTKKLGMAKIVDLKENSAVARLTNLAYDNAVRVGDGAKVRNIAGRSKFRDQSNPKAFEDAGDEAIILEPIFDGKRRKKAARKETPAPATDPVEDPMEKESPSNPTPTPTPAPVDELEEDSGEEWTDDIGAMLKKTFPHATFEAGPRLWKASGDASAKASFPLLIANHIAATGTGFMNDKIGYDATLRLDYGPTSNGDFTGFGAAARYYYYLTPRGAGMYYRAGGEARFNSLKVNDETFGGGDIFDFGGFGGAGGRAVLSGMSVVWDADLYLMLINFGQMGVGGSFETVSGGFGYGLRGNLYTDPGSNKGGLSYGVGLLYGTQEYSGSSTVTIDETRLLFGVRMAL